MLRHGRVLLALALAGAIGAVGRAEEEPGIDVQASLALDGWYRPGHWTAAVLRVRNTGAERSCRASVLAPGDTTEYSLALDLPRGSTLRVEIPFLPTDLADGLRLRLVDAADGTPLWADPAPPTPDRPMPACLVLATGRRAAALCRPSLDDEEGRAARELWLRAIPTDTLPNDGRALDALQALVLADPEDGAISPPQAAAIAEWVRSGGLLVLAWHPAWHPDAALADALPQPVDLRGTATLSIAECAAVFPGLVAKDALPVADATPRPGARILAECGGRVVSAALSFGCGRIVWLGLDLSSSPWSDGTGATRFWRALLGPSAALDRTADDPLPDVGEENVRLRESLGRALPVRWMSPWWLVGFTVLYAWAAGPGSLRVRRAARPLAPLLVIAVFATAAWSLARAALGTTAHARLLARVDLPAEGSGARGQAFGLVLLPDHRRIRLSAGGDSRLALLPAEPGVSLLPGARAGDWSDVSQRSVIGSGRAELEFAVRASAAEFFSLHWRERDAAPAVSARLVRDPGGVRLEVTQHTGAPLDDLMLVRDRQVFLLSRRLEQPTASYLLGSLPWFPADTWVHGSTTLLSVQPYWAECLLELTCAGPPGLDLFGRPDAERARRRGHDLRLWIPGLALGTEARLFAWSARPVGPLDATALPEEATWTVLYCVEVRAP